MRRGRKSRIRRQLLSEIPLFLSLIDAVKAENRRRPVNSTAGRCSF
ncbi:hypothetical protein HOLDEFILI_03715 [Holdemania filiformis DSM 12042]|uniref:Uncharacterized protein n=1 Tax=Holdemania filiformis DSM 12042 TaxID=545696 RepID=B9YD02_9FIRM|nr:hypothetical protein HOLDEFILI_03715 [Holdemania filiformis DSM 12042]